MVAPLLTISTTDRDQFTVGLAFLFLALVIREVVGTGRIGTRTLAGLAIGAFLVFALAGAEPEGALPTGYTLIVTIWFAGICHAVNLLDNMDGLSAGVATVVALFLSVFAFLLYLPVTLILATIAAFVVGYASIAFLLRFLASHSTIVFVVYRVALGAIAAIGRWAQSGGEKSKFGLNAAGLVKAIEKLGGKAVRPDESTDRGADLEASIRAYGLQYFKVKLFGDPGRDFPRLRRLVPRRVKQRLYDRRLRSERLGAQDPRAAAIGSRTIQVRNPTRA